MFHPSNWIHSFPAHYQWSNATLVTKGMAPYGAVALGEIDWVEWPEPMLGRSPDTGETGRVSVSDFVNPNESFTLVARVRFPKHLAACTLERFRRGEVRRWPVLLAGAGVPVGGVYGSSDRIGGYPATNPVSPADLTATFLHLLGIPPDTEIHDQTGKPYRVCHGSPVRGLLG